MPFKRIKKGFKRLAVAFVVLVLGGWLAAYLIVQHSIAQPPPLPADTPIFKLKPEQRTGKTWLGKSWTCEREGLRIVYLKGTPVEIGYADGVLMQDKMHTLEKEFLVMIQGYVPQHWLMELLKNYVIYRNRHLSDFIPMDEKLEIYAAS